MSSSFVDYNAPPRSPSYGFFPTGQTSPNSMGHFHPDPRQSHNMYSAFSSAASMSGNGGAPAGSGSSSRSTGSLKRLLSRNFK